MVGSDELAFYAATCGAVYHVPIYQTVAIDDVALTREMLVLGVDVESVGLRLCCTEFTAEVFAIYAEPELIGVGGVVPETVVQIVVGDASACAEGYLTAEIGEEVQPVVMVVLGDGQLAVEHHPMYQVGELA